MITIYAIDCEVPFFGSRFYVGSTKGKLNKRMREHRCLLRQGAHQCRLMQEHWTKYGQDTLHPIELEIFLFDESLENRRSAELKWMDVYAKDGTLLNEHRISMRPTDEAIRKGVANAHLSPGNRWTPEVNEKRRLAQLGKPKGHGAKISATKRAKREQVMR